MDKNVYVVTKGDYSDYHLVAVCETEAVAKEIIARACALKDALGYPIAKPSDFDLETYPLNTSVPKIYTHFAKLYLESGDVLHTWEDMQFAYERLNDPKVAVTVFDDKTIIEGCGASEEEAIKNAMDFRASYLAERDIAHGSGNSSSPPADTHTLPSSHF